MRYFIDVNCEFILYFFKYFSNILLSHELEEINIVAFVKVCKDKNLISNDKHEYFDPNATHRNSEAAMISRILKRSDANIIHANFYALLAIAQMSREIQNKIEVSHLCPIYLCEK